MALLVLLFLKDRELSVKFQQGLLMVIYDDCPEAYAILLQNKCDEKLIK